MISIFTGEVNTSRGDIYSRNFQFYPSKDPHLIAQMITKHAWSPIIFKQGIRKQSHFISARWVALDFDEPGITLAEAVDNIFCDHVHIIGTSKSHQKEKNGVVCDRFRVLLRLDKPCRDLQSYRATVSKLVGKYDADSACVDGARFFYPCTSIVSVGEDGFLTTVLCSVSKNNIVNKKPSKPSSKSPSLSPWIRKIYLKGVPAGQRNRTCWGAACDMLEAGYTKQEVYRIIYNSIPTTNDFTEEEKCKIINSAERAVNERKTKG